MQLSFSKMHGLGNDFVVIDATQNLFKLNAEQIKKLGNRHTGIGFDQLLVVEKPSSIDVDFDYRIFNCDGSEVEHCGNGARCFAKYVVDKKLTTKKQLKVKIKKGTILIDVLNDSLDDLFKVQMGSPILLPSEVPFTTDDDKIKNIYDIDLTIDESKKNLGVSVLSMGNPHAIILFEQLINQEIKTQNINVAKSDINQTGFWQYSIAEIGLSIQRHSSFPKSVNVSFVQIISNSEINLRVYERGAGETQACGTGACATVYALYKLGKIQGSVNVNLLGGNLQIEIIDNIIYMTGPAVMVFDGKIDLV